MPKQEERQQVVKLGYVNVVEERGTERILGKGGQTRRSRPSLAIAKLLL